MPTKTTVAPSPRPWATDEKFLYSGCDSHEMNAKQIVGKIGNPHEAWGPNDPDVMQCAANADLIVRAVNSHESLLSACRDLLAWVDAENVTRPTLLAVRDAARAAIAEAEGK